MILYGIPTCDTCKKALKALQSAGHDVTFHDIRAQPLTEDEWAPFIAEFGSNLVNRKSTTWRGLSDWLRESDTDAQLLAQPTLMKRPLIVDGDKMTLGWETKEQAAWGL